MVNIPSQVVVWDLWTTNSTMDPSKHMATPVKTNMDQATLVSMLNFWGAHVPTWGNDDSSEAPPSAPGLPCQRSSKQHMHRPEATKVEFSICTKRGFSLTAGLVWLVGWLGWLVGLDWWLSCWLVGMVGWVGLVTKLGGLVGCFFVEQVQN